MYSDTFYFLCLPVVLVCALICPKACSLLFERRHEAFKWAVLAGASAGLGVLGTSFFANTREMPWLPALGLAYFGAVIAIAVLYGVARRPDGRE